MNFTGFSICIFNTSGRPDDVVNYGETRREKLIYYQEVLCTWTTLKEVGAT